MAGHAEVAERVERLLREEERQRPAREARALEALRVAEEVIRDAERAEVDAGTARKLADDILHDLEH